MLTSSLILLTSLVCFSASLPVQSGSDPHWMLLRVRRGAVMAGSFYSAPLRKQECENCNQVAEDHLLNGESASSDQLEEVPELAEEAPEPKFESPKSPKVSPSDNDDEVPPHRKGGSKRNGSIYKNFFPMSFGTRAVRDVEEAEEGDADVRANAKAEPDDDENDDNDYDDDDFPEHGSVYKNFFPMNFGVLSRNVREAEGVEGGRGVGGVISIANSFSKGRGAVATSSATAYGAPSSSSSNNNQHRDIPPTEE